MELNILIKHSSALIYSLIKSYNFYDGSVPFSSITLRAFSQMPVGDLFNLT